jgi:glutathione S-transferase
MNPADEEAAKIVPPERPSSGAAAGSIDQLDEQLRVSVEALLHPSPPRKPVEELDDLLLAISHHLDQETSERKAIYYRLAAIESEMKRRSSRGFARYLVAICIVVAAILAWHSYGEAAKQIIATRAPELGWSRETKQTIANWVERLGWTPPPAGSAGTAVQLSAPPAAPSPDLQQVQQIEADIAAVRQAVERHLADVRETVEQLAASQEQMVREITKLQAADEEILEKIPAPPAQRSAAPARKPTPIARPSSRAPIPPHLPPHP